MIKDMQPMRPREPGKEYAHQTDDVQDGEAGRLAAFLDRVALQRDDLRRRLQLTYSGELGAAIA